MTNEEKAIELAENISPYDIGGDNAAHYAAKDAALEAMEWKDEQWKKGLQDALIGGWTASLDIENVSRKRTTTISFVKEDFEV